MKTKKQYIAPALCVVEFKTEKGFAFSIHLLTPSQKSNYNEDGIGEMTDNGGSTFGGDWSW